MRAVLGAELRRMAARRPLHLAALVCGLGPLLLAVVLGAQAGLPADTLFGRDVRASGAALPLLVLGFGGLWVLPLLASLVAGDVFAGDDAAGTWPALLTRSRTRSEVFAGKVAASALVSTGLLALTATSAVLGGLALAGGTPLVDLSGDPVPAGRALLLVAASWASVLPPLLGFTALSVLLSVRSRSLVVGVGAPVVVGLLMQLLALLGPLGSAAELLLTAPFTAWHGLVRASPYLGPLWQGLLVSAAWAAACLLPARRALLTRDVA